MFSPITDRFFELDNDCRFANECRKHLLFAKRYDGLIQHFFKENKVELIDYRFIYNEKLVVKTSLKGYERIKKLEDETIFEMRWSAREFLQYGRDTKLGNLWHEFLVDKNVYDCYFPQPKLKNYLVNFDRTITIRAFEFLSKIYLHAYDGGVKEMTFPSWCKEIDGERFFFALHVKNEDLGKKLAVQKTAKEKPKNYEDPKQSYELV